METNRPTQLNRNATGTKQQTDIIRRKQSNRKVTATNIDIQFLVHWLVVKNYAVGKFTQGLGEIPQGNYLEISQLESHHKLETKLTCKSGCQVCGVHFLLSFKKCHVFKIVLDITWWLT